MRPMLRAAPTASAGAAAIPACNTFLCLLLLLGHSVDDASSERSSVADSAIASAFGSSSDMPPPKPLPSALNGTFTGEIFAMTNLNSEDDDDGSYDLEMAIDDCNGSSNCAGVSYLIVSKHRAWGAFHTFIPTLPPEEDESDKLNTNEQDEMKRKRKWQLYRSPRRYVHHPGILNVGRESIIHTADHYLTIDEAKDYCDSRSDCVAFTFPIEASPNDITKARTVVFASKVDGVRRNRPPSPKSDTQGDGGGGGKEKDRSEWRTYISNDPLKADAVNHTSESLVFRLVQPDAFPYRTCCKRDLSTMPTIDDVMRIDSVQRIPCNISREEFELKYEVQRKPVILVGCDANWPAKHRWTHDALKNRFDESTHWRVELNESDVEEGGTWKDVVSAMSSGERFYIFDQLDVDYKKAIEEDYEIPGPFAGGDLYQRLRDMPGGEFPHGDYGSLRWFCAGTKYTGTDPHMDPHGTDAWNAVTHGHKWWILFPSSLTEDKEEDMMCDEDCSPDDALSPEHWYASVGVHASLMEFGEEGQSSAEQERPIHILQRPGETIYVPYGMIHSVFNMDETMAVTQNYGSPGNLEEVWKAVINEGVSRDLERLYYSVFTKEQRRVIREGPYWDDNLSFDEFIEAFAEWEEEDDEEEGEGEYEDEAEEEEDEDVERLFRCFKGVQEATGKNLVENVEELADADLMEKMSKSIPFLVEGMTNPKLSFALDAIQNGSRRAMEEFRDQLDFLNKFCDVMSEHFAYRGAV